jgi:hypothetical protein
MRRPTGPLAADRHGRLLAHKPDSGTDQTMFAAVPTQGRRTVYTAVGDLLAYLSAAGLLALLVVAVRPPRTAPLEPAS